MDVDSIEQLYRERAGSRYGDEAISQREHACQCALLAEESGADEELVAAAFLHDIGHLVHDLGEHCAREGVDDAHERRGVRMLRDDFGPEVTGPIALHVAAKRYLCRVEPWYRERLSPASIRSLELQGGPLDPAGLRAFAEHSHADAAIRLRHWDDLAKVPGRATPGVDHFLAIVRRCATSSAGSPAEPDGLSHHLR